MKIQEYLEKLIKHLGVEDDFEIVLEETDDRLKIAITVPSSDVALLIGNHGETLEALELLTKLSFKDDFVGKRIMLDVNEYRAALENRLKEKAISIAQLVLETKEAQEMYGLNSYERFLVHSVLAEDESLSGIESVSEDRDEERVLVIKLKEA
ncbi:KH domain-containing protein [Patescibacteria group bacterium]|nr:KH domain-containing protein [Patescibacteria group bacterium]